MGLSRQLERNQAKAAYKKFSSAWTKERLYQAAEIAAGRELPKNTPRLGRKPTFQMWLKMVKTAEARQKATPAEVQDFQDENMDLSWDEEEAGKPGETKLEGEA